MHALVVLLGGAFMHIVVTGASGALGRLVVAALLDRVPAPSACGTLLRRIRATGVAWTILRNSLYADLRVQAAARYIHDRQWTTNMGDGSHAFVARAD